MREEGKLTVNSNYTTCNVLQRSLVSRSVAKSRATCYLMLVGNKTLCDFPKLLDAFCLCHCSMKRSESVPEQVHVMHVILDFHARDKMRRVLLHSIHLCTYANNLHIPSVPGHR
jgi:hypothetical protein